MRRTVITSGICAAALYAVAIATAAQTPQVPSPPQTERPAPSQNRSETSNHITVTGCLQAAQPAPTGTAGTTETKGDPASSESKFVLTNASSSSDPASTTEKSAAARTYRLVANEAALSPHVGKKLELTGTVADQDSPNASSSDASTSSSSAASAQRAPKLMVESGKIVSESCSQ